MEAANPTPRMQTLVKNIKEMGKRLDSLSQQRHGGTAYGTSTLAVTGSAYPRSNAALSSTKVAQTRNRPLAQIHQQQQQQSTFASDQSKLEVEISQLKAEVSRLRRQNELLREKEHRLREAEIRADMYQKQVEELKDLPPRLFASRQISPERKRVRISDHATTSTPILRNEALNERLKEVQQENIELRSRLAGVTPKNSATAANLDKCRGCRDLNRQKAHQANYLEEKVLAARQRLADYQQHCDQLRAEMTGLKKMLTDIQSKYQKQIDQLSEHASLYKTRSERLERWNRSALRGFQTDIKLIRDKLGSIEKEIVQTQLLCAENA